MADRSCSTEHKGFSVVRMIELPCYQQSKMVELFGCCCDCLHMLLQAVDTFHRNFYSMELPSGAQVKHRDIKPGCCLHAL